MSNGHIFEYLDYYVDLPHAPHYAVMVTGPWGIGKSFSIKRYLNSLRGRGKKVAYVSLYGVKSTDDIAVSLLAALMPGQDNKLLKLSGQIGRALWRKLPGGAGEAAVSWIPDSFCDLLVLDDLERALLSPVEVLGFVNSFIEHEDRRVAIVANEAEIQGKKDYIRVREKVIGMTFELAEETDAALAHFIACIEDEATREFLSGVSESILQIFNQSKTQNLRVLDQSLQSWQRVFKVIDPALKKKEAGIATAFKLFLALSIEVRSGRIQRQDLTRRIDQIVAGNLKKSDNGDKVGTPLSEAQDRYDRISLHNSILSDEVLEQVFCYGRIDASAINAALSVNELFVAPDEEPNWRKVWHGFLRDSSEFEPAFAAMEKEFADRKFDESGIVLHVLGLRLWGAEIGELKKSENEIVEEGRAYIDDLREKGRLRRYGHQGFQDAAHGLTFHNASTAGFQTLLRYFMEQSELAYHDVWAALGESLLADMSGDAEKFFTRVCWSGGQAKPDCAEDAILSRTAPKAFVDKLLTCSPQAQRTILKGLKTRYEGGRLANTLAAEGPWLNEMHQELQCRIPHLARIRQYSVTHDTARLLGDALKQAQTAIHTPS